MSQTLVDLQTKALRKFSGADDAGKSLLKEVFGEDFFPGKIIDRVKTFEDACMIMGRDPSAEEFSRGAIDENAFIKLKVVVAALNEGWIPDWNNSSEWKWYPWFRLNSPGFRFDGSAYDDEASHSAVGSRLCVHSKELSDYLGNQFLHLYKDLLN